MVYVWSSRVALGRIFVRKYASQNSLMKATSFKVNPGQETQRAACVNKLKRANVTCE
jgi:hypothetical protein